MCREGVSMFFTCRLRRVVGEYVPGRLEYLIRDAFENPGYFARLARRVIAELYDKYTQRTRN